MATILCSCGHPEEATTGYVKEKGYKLIEDNSEWKIYQVHRLVAEAFIPNPLNLEQINHKDENPSNNNVDNLEWCSRIYNVNYGTGIDRQVAKRSKKVIQLDLNGNIINEFNSTQEASRILGISQGLISNCCNGGYWRDKHSKFIKCTRVGEFKFKFKEDEINKS